MKMRKLTIALLVAAAAVACTKSDNIQGNIPEGYGAVVFDANPSGELTTRAGDDEKDVYYLTNQEGYYPEGATKFVAEDVEMELPTVGENSNMKLTLKSYKNDKNPYLWPNPESENPDLDNPEDTTIKGYNDMAMQRYLLEGQYEAVVTWGDADYEGPIVDGVKPYFYGRERFEIEARATHPITMKPVLGNSIVRVLFSQDFKSYFENGAEFTIKTKLKAEGETEAKEQNSFKIVYVEEILAGATLPEGTYIEGMPFFIKNGKGRSFSITGWAKKQNPTGKLEGEKVEFRDIVPLSTAGMQNIDVEASDEPSYRPYYPKMFTFFLTVEAGSVKVGVTINDLPDEADTDKWITIVENDVELNDDAVVE